MSAHAYAKTVRGFFDSDTREMFVKRNDTLKGAAQMLPTALHEALQVGQAWVTAVRAGDFMTAKNQLRSGQP